MSYRLGNPDQVTGKITEVYRLSDGALIPTTDERNYDYQAYLKWLEEGNEPEPPTVPFNPTPSSL